MKFTLESPSAVTVRSVADGRIVIGNQEWSVPVALAANAPPCDWRVSPVDSIRVGDLQPLIDSGADLIVIGTGRQQILPDRQLMFAMARRGVGLEVMNTAAAARTFNVLVSEGRSVAAVLYP